MQYLDPQLYFSRSTNVATYARALAPLQKALVSDKRHLVRWCAGGMCRGQEDPKEILSWLQMLSPQVSNELPDLMTSLFRTSLSMTTSTTYFRP